MLGRTEYSLSRVGLGRTGFHKPDVSIRSRSDSPYRPSAFPNNSSLLESAKNVGAQSPTKMPNRSPWALDSAASPPVKNQIAIDAIIDANPNQKQRVERLLDNAEFIGRSQRRGSVKTCQNAFIAETRENAISSFFKILSSEPTPPSCRRSKQFQNLRSERPNN